MGWCKMYNYVKGVREGMVVVGDVCGCGCACVTMRHTNHTGMFLLMVSEKLCQIFGVFQMEMEDCTEL